MIASDACESSTTFFIPNRAEEGRNKISEIIDEKLYIGDSSNAMDTKLLKTLGVTHVLNVCGWGNLACTRKWEKEWDSIPGNNISVPHTLLLKVRDLPSVNIAAHFETCFDYLDEAIKSEESKILLHCQAGISRSITVCIAYLMKRNNWGLDQAYDFVLMKRPIIRPNQGFMQQLIDFHRRMWGTAHGSEKCERRLRLNYIRKTTNTE
jgi:hypothetical protein